MRKDRTMPRRILRLRVSIDTTPDIWRLLEIDAGLSLADMHDVLQIVFGWHDTHLHEFAEHDPAIYGIPRIGALGRKARVWRAPHSDNDIHTLDEADDALGAVLDSLGGSPLHYQYDFGDDWWHRIDLIEDIEDDPRAPRARVIRGARSGPLENSGGAQGYGDLLDALADATHPEHGRLRVWADMAAGPWRRFDPEAFDVDHVNRELAFRFDGEDETDISRASPLAHLLERMPPSACRDIRGMLRQNRPSARKERPLAALSVILDLAHDPGLPLTDAGWLRPALVERIMADTGWTNDWIGKGNREDLTPPVASLRQAAVRLKLLRKFKGALLLTRAGNAARKSNSALWREVTAAVASVGRSQGERDATVLLLLEVACATPYAGRGSAIAEGLTILGYAASSGDAIDADVVHHLLVDVTNVLDAAGITLDDASLARAALCGKP